MKSPVLSFSLLIFRSIVFFSVCLAASSPAQTTLDQNQEDSLHTDILFPDPPESNRPFKTIFRHGKGFMGIDKNGKILFQIFTFDNGPDYVSEKKFRIVENQKIGFANTRGDIIIHPQFDAAFPFSEGFAAVCSGCIKIKSGEHTEVQNGKWGFINASGDIVINLQFDHIISSFENGKAIAIKDNKKVVLSKPLLPDLF